ncbi:MAG: hypothetical protein LQ340_006454 [Diploschistes diacapsis]|nr:MAG: hypothetical protein LQ340_006454 [Diploschistes diacapsis]
MQLRSVLAVLPVFLVLGVAVPLPASEYETRSAEAADLDSDVTRCLAGFKRSDDIANDGVSRCLAGFRRDAETVNDDVSRCLAGFKREEDTAEYDSTVSRCFAGF